MTALISALLFAELSSKIQRTGSTYIYAYIISGEFMAWYVGWNMFMQYGICASVQAQGFNSFFLGFLKANGLKDSIPVFLTDLYINEKKVYPLTLLFIFFCTFIVTQGTKKSDKANQIICLVKLAIVTLIVIIAFWNQDKKYFKEDPSVSTED